MLLAQKWLCCIRALFPWDGEHETGLRVEERFPKAMLLLAATSRPPSRQPGCSIYCLGSGRYSKPA